MSVNRTGDPTDAINLLKRQNNNSEIINSGEIIKGLFAIFADVLSMVVAASSVQMLERSIPDFELNLFRYSAALASYGLFVLVKKQLPVIPRSEIIGSLCFCLLSITTSVCLFVAVTLIPVSAVESLRITSAIISGTFMFAIFWDEKMACRNIVPAILCCGGVLLVIQPEFIFKRVKWWNPINNMSVSNMNTTLFNFTESDSNNAGYNVNSTLTVIGYCLPIITGIGVTFTLILLKRRPYISEHMTHVLFWSFATGTILSAIAMLLFESVVIPRNWPQILLIIVHCFCFIIGWPLLLYAVQRLSGNTINIINSTSVVLMLVPQYTVLLSILPGQRNWMEGVGAVLVLSGSVFRSVQETIMCNSQ